MFIKWLEKRERERGKRERREEGGMGGERKIKILN